MKIEKPHNDLSPGEAERLALLVDELGEAQVAVAKILRHGYESRWPAHQGPTNRKTLAVELGHVDAAIDLLCGADDLESTVIERSRRRKLVDVRRWLHHNPIEASQRSTLVPPLPSAEDLAAQADPARGKIWGPFVDPMEHPPAAPTGMMLAVKFKPGDRVKVRSALHNHAGFMLHPEGVIDFVAIGKEDISYGVVLDNGMIISHIPGILIAPVEPKA